MSIIDQIKSRLPIEQVAREYLPTLRQQNSDRLVAHCVFHDGDTNASLQIEPSKGTFYCFGCQARGDVVDFVQRVTNVSQKQAISLLAKQAGIVSQQAPELSEQQKTYLRIKKAFQRAHEAYTRNFWAKGSPALQYMLDRGIKEETLKAFGIGYAPSHSDAVQTAVKSTGLSAQEAADCGVLSISKQGKLYDPMFGRIVFPIHSPGGDLVGFSGRVLPQDEEGQVKYKNTMATDYFQKGSCLFGLQQAEKHIRSVGYVNVVEGYMDVLSMHQSGFSNCVAPMGTAITPAQIRLLHQHTGNVMSLMDGDAAGRAASFKALDLMLREGLQVKVARLSDGEDPDSVLTTPNGSNLIRQALKSSVPGLELWLSDLATKSPEQLATWVRSFITSFSDRIVQIFWAKRVSGFLGVTARDVLAACDALEDMRPPETKEKSEARLIQ